MSPDAGHERDRALSTEARLNAWLDRVRAEAGEVNRRSGLLLEHMRTQVARERTRDVHVRTDTEAIAEAARAHVRADADQVLGDATGDRGRKDAEHTAEVAQVREEAREAPRYTAQPTDQVRAEARPDGAAAQADADEGLAARQRQWRAVGARAQEAAIQDARPTSGTEAAATLAAEQERWADGTARAVAAAVKQARADADQALAAEVEVAIREARSTADAEAAAARAAEVARVRAKGEEAVSLAVASVRGEANQARAAAISRVRTQVRHALLQSKRIIAQVRGEANRQRKAAEVEAQTEAAAALAAEQARWADETDRALAAAVEQTKADAAEDLAAREREWHAAAARAQEAAVQAACATVETKAAAALAVAQEFWEDEAEQALAAAVKKTQADADRALTAAFEETQAEADRRLTSRERQWKAAAAQEHDPVIDEAPDTESELDLRLLDGSARGDGAPPATPDVHETLDVPGPDGEFERDLRLFDSDAQPGGAAAMATIQAWHAEDTPTQQAAVQATRATDETVADRQSSPTEPEALPVTGWTRFLRRSKPPRPSAKGRSSGS